LTKLGGTVVTKTFGRRGATVQARSPFPGASPAAAVPNALLDLERDAAPFEGDLGAKSLTADIPFLTVCIIALLVLIFGMEKRLAFDAGKSGALSIGSLIAFVSYHLVVVSGEWWRITLAPLLHASPSHLLGNCFALFLVGTRLETMIGRGWLTMIFVASALGGVVGSLLGNPPDLSSVGASGAITGLVGALFVASFHHSADPAQQYVMRRTSMTFGIPALLPLAWGASGHVDYFAHAGGALVGGALGLALCMHWPTDGSRPNPTRLAIVVGLLALGASIVSCGYAATRYSTYAAKALELIPASEMPPKIFNVSAQRSAELLARYPKDPRSHLVRAAFLMQANKLSEAETEFRATIAMASTDPGGRPTLDVAQTSLAVLLAEQGRREEAKTLAAALCHAKDKAALKPALDKAKLCD
jgi:rhomboid protease GluP